jgi:hypothetical protein
MVRGRSLSLIIQIILTLVIITALFFIYKRYKTDEEDYLTFKLIGYYLLGTFRFNLNSLALPAGFIAFWFLFKPKTNISAKKAAVYLGLFFFFYGLLMPSFQEAYFERERQVAASSANIYSLDLKGDLEAIKQKLEIEESVKIEDFDVNFENLGTIKDLRFTFLTRVNDGFVIYHVNLSIDENKYVIWPRKVKQWVQFDRLIEEEQFFYALKHLDLKEAKPKQEYPYYTIKCRGDYTSWAAKDWENYLITETGTIKVENEKLPIEGYGFWIFGNKKIGEGSYESDGNKAYILSY